MGFLQPLLLWGAAAISIPILIHLWHKRRGKKIQWAAMRWLIDKEDKPKKGFKPDHLLLLFLRMLIIILAVIFLSQPYLNNLSDDVISENIHLVEPNHALINEFRFELGQALSDGEKLYWLDEELLPISSLEEVSRLQPGMDKAMIEALNKLVEPNHQLHLYLSPNSAYLEAPFYLTQVKPQLHLSEYTLLPRSDKYMETADSEYLYVNEQGVLKNSQTPPQGRKAIDQTVPITYSIDLENEEEINNITTSLEAIRDIYGLGFEEVNNEANLVFTYELPPGIKPEQLLIISNNIGNTEYRNVFIEPEPFTKDESEIVASGSLPEYILNKIIGQYQLMPDVRKVSRQQLEQQFKVEPIDNPAQTGNMNELIILILLLTITAERIVALRKGM